MTHSHVRELLSPYLDDEVSAEERGMVVRHLDACASCRFELAALERVVGLSRAVPCQPAPESLRAGIRARIALLPGAARGRRGAGRIRPFAAAAAAVVIGAFAWSLWGPSPIRLPAPPSPTGRAGTDTSFRPTEEAAQRSTPRAPRPDTGNGQPKPQAPSGARGQARPHAAARLLIRSARIEIDVDGYGATAAYGATASRLRDISAGAGGSIVEIRDHAPGHPARTGFTLRVPSERFAETMGQVEALGGARRERITERDAAADLAALRSRLRDLERREQELSVSAARSRGAAEGRSAEDELARARGRIAEVRAQMSSLSQQIAMPVITVFLVERTMDRRHR